MEPEKPEENLLAENKEKNEEKAENKEKNEEMENNVKEEEKKEINEKVQKKLREFQELRIIFNIPNCTLRFKHNLSQIIQERIEKNINLNNSKNNYYTKANPTTDIFDLRSIINNMFNPYLKSHHIEMDSEIEKYEKERNEKEKENLSNKVKVYGVKMKEKLLNKKNNEENNEIMKKIMKQQKEIIKEIDDIIIIML